MDAPARDSRRIAGASLVLMALLAVPAAARPSVLDWGPLPVRDRFVLGLGCLILEPAAPEPVAEGHWQLGATLTVANSWSQSDEVRRSLEGRDGREPLELADLRAIEPRGERRGLFHADGQIHALTLSLRRGFGRGLEVRVQTAITEVSGGFADTLIEDFHRLTGFGQATRDRKVRDVYAAYLRSPDGDELFRENGSGLRLADLLIAAKKHLPGSDRWDHAVEAVLELPTGSESTLVGSDSLDLGLRYLAELRRPRARWRVALGAVRHGGSDLAAVEAETLLSIWLGYERALGRRVSLLAQGSYAESWFKSFGAGRLEDEIVRGDLGLKYAHPGRGAFFVAFSQNLNRASSSDIGIHFGWLGEL